LNARDHSEIVACRLTFGYCETKDSSSHSRVQDTTTLFDVDIADYWGAYSKTVPVCVAVDRDSLPVARRPSPEARPAGDMVCRGT